MEFHVIKSGRGYRYICDNKLYVRTCTNKETQTKYLRCIHNGCMGRAKINGNRLILTYDHIEHDASTEIARSTIKETCRKRAADIPNSTLRQIFSEEVGDSEHATSISFTEIFA